MYNVCTPMQFRKLKRKRHKIEIFNNRLWDVSGRSMDVNLTVSIVEGMKNLPSSVSRGKRTPLFMTVVAT